MNDRTDAEETKPVASKGAKKASRAKTVALKASPSAKRRAKTSSKAASRATGAGGAQDGTTARAKAARGASSAPKARAKPSRGAAPRAKAAVKAGGAKATAARAPSRTKAPANAAAPPSAEPAVKRRRRVSARRSVTPVEVAPPGPEPRPSEARPSGAEEQLFEIEHKLDHLLLDADSIAGDPVARRRAAEALSQIAQRLGAQAQAEGEPGEERRFEHVRDLLTSDHYLRQWGRLAMRHRSEEVDDFGLDPAYEARLLPLFEALYRKWFRVECEGIDNVPAHGRALLVSNHGGPVPWDGVMLKMAIRLEHPARTEMRWLAEDFIFHMPFLGAFMNRIGAVRACQENAERLLAREKLVAVFPEGIKGIGKLYRQRYQLQRFGRGGYVKLALRTGTPLIPTAVVGSEETNPLLFKVVYLTKTIGLPFLPVTPTFPWLGPLGLLPLPSRWRIVFGEPIAIDDHGPDAWDDAVLIHRLNDKIRATIQSMLDASLAKRPSAFLG